MSKETPLQAMKRLYGNKEKLVDAVVQAARDAGDDVSELKDRLATLSNRKLLRLAEVSKAVKEKYGSRDKLVEALGKAVGKVKDSDYLEKLRTLPMPRLLDMVRSAERRAKRDGANPS
jgi:hypothetical protein